jgi:small GTP-binding protein
MPETGETAKLKVCLVGDEGVGKSSLIRQFVRSEFDEAYHRTVGVVVHKRVVYVTVAGATHEAVLTVWDIIGRHDFSERYRDAFFVNASGVLAVCDLTRSATVDSLGQWLERVQEVTGPVPVVVLANKKDLVAHVHVAEDDLLALCELFKAPFLETSAKTGLNVERAFATLAEIGVRDALARLGRPSIAQEPEAPRLRHVE